MDSFYFSHLPVIQYKTDKISAPPFCCSKFLKSFPSDKFLYHNHHVTPPVFSTRMLSMQQNNWFSYSPKFFSFSRDIQTQNYYLTKFFLLAPHTVSPVPSSRDFYFDFSHMTISPGVAFTPLYRTSLLHPSDMARQTSAIFRVYASTASGYLPLR